MGVDLVTIYECLCDRTRLRLLNVLLKGPLCVCHFQAVLGEPQVKISKHLAYLRRSGLVTAKRSGNWMIYGVPDDRPVLLERNLACLRDCVADDPAFQKDLVRLKKVKRALDSDAPAGVRGRASKRCGCA